MKNSMRPSSDTVPCFCKFTGHRGKYEANDAHPEYVGWLRGGAE